LVAGANRPSCRSQRTVGTVTRNDCATSSIVKYIFMIYVLSAVSHTVTSNFSTPIVSSLVLMLQLATLPTRGARGALDLLITPAVEQHLVGCSALPKSVRTGLAVTICSSNLAERTSALLIGAGYMVVNELALSPGGLGRKAAFPPT
jgi:hypothetical protein